MIHHFIRACEQRYIPDRLIRFGIRNLCKDRLHSLNRNNPELCLENTRHFIQQCNELPHLAEKTDEANEQHYELPTQFFKLVLGKYLKYSCCLYPDNTTTLSEAELLTLRLYEERADIHDGQSILDLGCGWGSLSLYLAKKYPKAAITAVSNSVTQREFITKQINTLQLNNLDVITCDVNHFSTDTQFDRIISVEMMEHVKNHHALFNKISSWLKPDGKLFVHIFCHLLASYPFIAVDDSDWMAKYFFTGGIMPADNQFLYCQDHLKLIDHWHLNGQNYERTANAWLNNLDKHRHEIVKLFTQTYGLDAKIWLQRWRIFFMSCAELFGYANGSEWLVSHYLFRNCSP